MPLTVNMPQLGESVTEGTIARWLKHPGEPVARYESIAEVITDKVNAEIPAPADGVMGEIIAPEGTVVAVGQPICSIETEAASAPPQEQRGAPASAPAQEQPGTPAPAPPQSTAPAQVSPPAIAASSQSESEADNGAGYHMTPAVRMLVREHDVDVAQVQGSGIGGRITKKDVVEYRQQRRARRPPAPAG